MKNAEYPRQQVNCGYETFDNPERAYACAMLLGAIVDFARLGLKRHRQRCHYGRDWQRHPHKRPNHIPAVYVDVHQKIEFLYSRHFGLIADTLDLDLEVVQSFLLRLMSGTISGDR